MRKLLLLFLGIWLLPIGTPSATVNAAATQYHYDSNSRLTYTTLPNGNVVESKYNANGNVISRTIRYPNTIVGPRKVDLSSPTYDVYVYGVSKTAAKVQFPTWTEYNGQDDIGPWVEGTKVADGVWKATIAFDKHNNETGKYITHVYVDDKGLASGIVTEVTASAVTIKGPAEVNVSPGSYEIFIENVSEQVSKVRFPTWTASGDQDDLEWPWVEGQQVAPRTWKVNIPFSKHNYEAGSYITHIYTEDSYGNKQFVGAHTATAKTALYAPSKVDLSNASYDVYVYGVSKTAGKVQLPTWTDYNGHDDLESPWIEAAKVRDGVWKINIPFHKHKNETGLYVTHAYIDGTGLPAGNITEVVPTSAVVRGPAETNVSSGYYEVYADNVSEGAAKVYFPTWTIYGGQDDIEWMEGQRVNERTWKVQVPFGKHNFEAGSYVTHVYTEDIHGNKQFIGQNTTNAKTAAAGPLQVSLSSKSYDVYVYGVDKAAQSVTFPTWTELKGQDDLEIPWVAGTKVSDGVWKINIPFSKHNNETGNYITHVYVDGKGLSTGSVTEVTNP